MRIIRSVTAYLQRKPAPAFVIALILSLRWRCKISLKANIYYPWRLVLGKGARIQNCTIIASGNGITLGANTELGDGAILDSQTGWIKINEHAAIGPFVVIYGQGGVSIGQYSMIATHSTIVASSHVYISKDIPIRLQGTTAFGIQIADDVWIGANAVVQDGVSIGKGCVIGSGAVVRTNILEYSVAVGVPAKVVKFRN